MIKLTIIALLFLSSGLYSQDIYKDLQLYLPMNCNTLDSSSNNIPTNAIGNLSCVEGKLFQALEFNGTDNAIQVDEFYSNDLISQNGFSWSLWIKSSSYPKNNQPGRAETFISAASPLDAEDIYIGFGSLSSPRNEISFIVDGPGGAGSSAAGNNAILSWKPTNGFIDDEWYHVVGTRNYSNGRVELFINGSKVDSANFPLSVTAFQKKLEFSIGRFFDGRSDIGSNYSGLIDEVRIYDRVITNQEILILYSARPEQLKVDTNYINFSNIQCRVDSVIITDILNIGPSDFIISDMNLKSGEAFSLLNSGQVFLTDQEVYSLGIRFEPQTEGIFYDTLLIENNFGVQPLILYLEGEKEVKIQLKDTIRVRELVACMEEEFTSNTFYIYNENIDYGLEIESITTSPNFYTSTTFEKIEKGDSLLAEIFFKPLDFGSISETVTINFTNCNQSRTFTLLSKYTKLEANYANQLDFGNVENGVYQAATFTIENIGTTNFDIYNVYFKNNNEFTLLTDPNQFIMAVPPGNIANLEIAFTPLGGLTIDTMFVNTWSLCGQKIYAIPLYGKGVYRANLDFSIPVVQAKLGEKVNIPIIINEVDNFALSEIDSLRVEFEINATSLIMENSDYVERDVYFKKYFKHLVVDNTLSTQQFDLFEAEVVLGNSSKPEIYITNITALDGLLNYSSNQSNVEITDICNSGDINRLFMSSFWFTVDEPSPNPTNGQFTLNFELIEEGQTHILLYNSNGNLVEILFSNIVLPGKYKTKFDLSYLESGIYFLNIITPSHNVNKKIIIQK